MSQLSLVEVIADLRRELEQAIEQAAEQKLRFEAGVIEVELSVQIEATGNAGIKFWVVGVGAAAGQSRTHTIKIPLKPVTADGRPVLTGGSSIIPT
jgi:hypothetical protein